MNIDTPVATPGTSPQQNALRVGTNGFSQFQVCNFGLGTAAAGANVFGSTVACPSIYTTTLAKNIFMSRTASPQIGRMWQGSNAQTGAFLDMNTATAAGTGFNFFEGWTGVTGTDTFHAGGTKTFAIQGDGSYLMNGCGSGTYLKADGTGCGTPAGGAVAAWCTPGWAFRNRRAPDGERHMPWDRRRGTCWRSMAVRI